jgi:hypothetical protein
MCWVFTTRERGGEKEDNFEFSHEPKGLTVGKGSVAGWVWFSCSSHSPSASPRTAGVDFVYTTIFRLHVLDLLDIFQAVDSTAKVYLPDSWVRVLPVLARVYRPFTKERCISLTAVAPLLRMDPGNFENSLLLV